MTEPRSKSETLSETAKTHIKDIVKSNFFEYKKEIWSKEMQKGIDNESKAIEILSSLHFEQYTKNEIRKDNGWLTGECDIITPEIIRDTKCCWSLETFPFFQEDAENAVKKSGYDWQLRGYMMLYNRDTAYVDFVMTSTPEELLKEWDNRAIHDVEHIDPRFRVTSVEIKRDLALEDKIKQRYEQCNEYYKELIKQIK